MEKNLINEYYLKKKKNIFDYVRITKKSLEATHSSLRRISLEQIYPIINRYIDDSDFSLERIHFQTVEFLNRNNISHYKFKNIVNYTILYIDTDEIKNNLEQYTEEIILISKLLYLAFEMENKIDILQNEKVTYASVVKNILNENWKLYDEELTKQILKQEKELKENMKFNIMTNRNFFKQLKNDNFYLTFDKYFTQEEETVYISKFHYKIKTLNKYKKADIEYQIEKKKLEATFCVIEAEILSMILLKLIAKRQKDFIMLIKIPKLVLENEDCLNEIISKFSNYKVKSKISFLIDYKVAMKNKNALQKIKEQNIKITLKENGPINHNKDKEIFEQYIDYIILNRSNKEVETEELLRTTNTIKIVDLMLNIKPLEEKELQNN